MRRSGGGAASALRTGNRKSAAAGPFVALQRANAPSQPLRCAAARRRARTLAVLQRSGPAARPMLRGGIGSDAALLFALPLLPLRPDWLYPAVDRCRATAQGDVAETAERRHGLSWLLLVTSAS